MKEGDSITLTPTEGCYQTPMTGKIVRITPQRFVVDVPWVSGNTHTGRKYEFWQANGAPHGYWAHQFPCYWADLKSLKEAA